MAGSAGLTFKLFGEDVSASDALDKIGGKGKAIAGAISAAFAGMALGDALSEGLANSDVLATFTAGLGQAPAVAKEAGDLAGELYRNGIGTSLEDVTNGISAVGMQMVDLSKTGKPELSKITSGAMAIAKVMGVDVVDVTKAAGQMMKNGLAPNAQAALDVIATGATNGANKAGDLLDTINEYSPQFKKLGIDGPTALAMIKTGMDNGVYSSDLAADAFKEFSIRSIDGSKTTGAAYVALGLNGQQMAADIAKGGPAAQTATSTILQALGSMTDPVAQNLAGVALFGSQWEDTGGKAILAMDPVLTKTGDLSGATSAMGDTIQDTAQNKVDVIQRHLQGFLTDITNLPGPLGTLAGTAVAIGPQILEMGGSVAMAAMATKDLAVWSKIAAGVSGIKGIAMAIPGLIAAMGPLIVTLAAAVALIKYIIDHRQQIANTPWNALHSSDAQGAKDYFSGPLVSGFATGGVVMPRDGGRLINAGEAGEPEAVIPLSKWSQMTGGMSGGNTEVHVHVNGFSVGSSSDLARNIVDTLNREARRGSIPGNALARLAG